MSTELERTRRALEGARHALGMIERNPQVLTRHDYLPSVQKEIDAILHPEPEYEEVELVRWAIFTGKGDILAYYADKEDGARSWPEHALVKLTGTLRRPKPQKVERSVSVANCVILSSGEIVIDNGPCPHNIYPFEARQGLYGQRGALTFTWAEEGEGK